MMLYACKNGYQQKESGYQNFAVYLRIRFSAYDFYRSVLVINMLK